MRRNKEYVLLVILSIAALAAAGSLFQIWKGYHEADAGYQKLKKYIIERTDLEKDHKRQTENQEEPEDDLPEIDFAGLRAINPDIVAWIQIPGIGVDYPVVQGKDNGHYLHYTFDGKANKAGSIFLDYRNRADFMDSKVILYGHNMKDGSMFSNLKKYQDGGFRKEQGEVLLYLPDRTLKWEIVESRTVHVQDSVYGLMEHETQELPDRMILSTCSSSSNMRLILICNVK